jgi:hypothetical protein
MPIDYKKYPANWKTEIRPAVLLRAGNRCEECLVPNYAIVYRPVKGSDVWWPWPEGMESEALSIDGHRSVKIILTVAHLDHDPENHDVKLDRLKALCQLHHLRLDKDHHAANRAKNKNKQNFKLEL